MSSRTLSDETTQAGPNSAGQSGADQDLSDTAEERTQRIPEGAFIVAGPLYPPDDGMADKCSAPASSGARGAPGFLQFPKVDAECNSRGYGSRRLRAECAAVRGGVCGTPVISDRWEGFFWLGKEIPIADSGEDAMP
jgi:hypothetical protein